MGTRQPDRSKRPVCLLSNYQTALKKNGLPLNLNVFVIIIIALIVAAIGYALNDSLGAQLELFGALFWFSVFGVTFIFVLLYFAQFITPLRGSDGWWQGWYLMLRAYFTTPAASIKLPGRRAKKKRAPGKRRRRQDKKKAQPAQETLPPSFALLNAGLLRPYQVIAVSKGKQYVGPKGPGFTILGRKENARKLVDLRKQKRNHTIKVTTRDGIQIEAAVEVEFQVARPVNATNDRLLYPYEPEAIFYIAYADTIDENGVTQSWTSQIITRAAALALTELARYALDDILQPDKGVSGKVAEVVQRRMEALFKPHHIQILVVKVNPTIRPEVWEQQEKRWKSEWEHKTRFQENKGQAEADRRLKRARAVAQIEIIEKIARSISAARQEDEADLAHVITLRMIEALEEIVSTGSVQTLVPQQIMANLVADTSRQMKRWERSIPPPYPSAHYQGGEEEERP